eukprot:366038-Chlamydomonas_euryale.AAC.7
MIVVWQASTAPAPAGRCWAGDGLRRHAERHGVQRIAPCNPPQNGSVPDLSISWGVRCNVDMLCAACVHACAAATNPPNQSTELDWQHSMSCFSSTA